MAIWRTVTAKDIETYVHIKIIFLCMLFDIFVLVKI